MSDFAPSHGESIDQERSHAFDGITEYDNSLPRWWLWTLYLSSAFAVCYVFYYHFYTGELPKKDADRYELKKREEKIAEKSKVKTEDELRALSKDPAMAAKGKALMTKTVCFTCHGPELTGLIGPNLRDKYWIYGSNMTTIIETISNGRPPLMPPKGGSVLSAEDVEAIA
ncbi:MAG TPA: cbb3-type cytochrome c oxidase N-terminal domain-containing protein, partial [Planctomycetota bacterium]|nr:cbb3-type cytochrome c oxidase N-terminal domain-containing protein [Planctomycetota bacterium]